MKSNHTTPAAAKPLENIPQMSSAQVDSVAGSEEEGLEETQAHDLRRESGHSQKNQRHAPHHSNHGKPSTKA